MNIAVVGDVHGHLALMYAILARWQKERQERIDLILQVGDLGAFLPTSTLDRATRRHAERDPEELGFTDFAGEQPLKTPLDPRPPLVFIPGNHEDFELLDRADLATPATQAVFPVSHDGRILALRSARVFEFASGGERVRVAGISGISERGRKSVHPRVHLDEEDIVTLASNADGAFDILITHEAPAGLADGMRHGSGSGLLRLVVESTQPRFAFFGHHGRSGEWRIGRTEVRALADCGYRGSASCSVAPDGVVIVR